MILQKKNNHQYIHLKFCHRAYLAPIMRHRMGLAPDLYCSSCLLKEQLSPSFTLCGNFQGFWNFGRRSYPDRTNGSCFTSGPCYASSTVNDNSHLGPSGNARKVWQAGLTTAKRIVVQRWKPPHDISSTHWLFGHFIPGTIFSKD